MLSLVPVLSVPSLQSAGRKQIVSVINQVNTAPAAVLHNNICTRGVSILPGLSQCLGSLCQLWGEVAEWQNHRM